MIILLGTALAKLVSSLQEASVLGEPDPLFKFLSTRQLLFGTAALELVVVRSLTLRDSSTLWKLTVLLWLSSGFLIYRLGLLWVGQAGACPCVGNVTGWLGLSTSAADWYSRLLLGYLFVGSGLCLLIHGRRRIPVSSSGLQESWRA